MLLTTIMLFVPANTFIASSTSSTFIASSTDLMELQNHLYDLLNSYYVRNNTGDHSNREQQPVDPDQHNLAQRKRVADPSRSSMSLYDGRSAIIPAGCHAISIRNIRIRAHFIRRFLSPRCVCLMHFFFASAHSCHHYFLFLVGRLNWGYFLGRCVM